MSFRKNFGTYLSSTTPTLAGTRIFDAGSNGSKNLTSEMPVYGTRLIGGEPRPDLPMPKNAPQQNEQYQGNN